MITIKPCNNCYSWRTEGQLYRSKSQAYEHAKKINKYEIQAAIGDADLLVFSIVQLPFPLLKNTDSGLDFDFWILDSKLLAN